MPPPHTQALGRCLCALHTWSMTAAKGWRNCILVDPEDCEGACNEAVPPTGPDVHLSGNLSVVCCMRQGIKDEGGAQEGVQDGCSVTLHHRPHQVAGVAQAAQRPVCGPQGDRGPVCRPCTSELAEHRVIIQACKGHRQHLHISGRVAERLLKMAGTNQSSVSAGPSSLWTPRHPGLVNAEGCGLL